MLKHQRGSKWCLGMGILEARFDAFYTFCSEDMSISTKTGKRLKFPVLRVMSSMSILYVFCFSCVSFVFVQRVCVCLL